LGKHRVLIDSAFGSYAVGRKPTAVGNAFIYDDPALLLWVDEILCDEHAFAGEKAFAADGWLASQIFVKLAEARIVKPQAFSSFFSGRVVAGLRVASQSDFRAASKGDRRPTSTVDPDRLREFEFNGFYDMNALLFLSQNLGVPYVDVSQTEEYYAWKIGRVVSRKPARPKDVFRQVLSLLIPSVVICPATKDSEQASRLSSVVFAASEAWAKGEIAEGAYRRVYNECMDSWHRYDDSVREQSLDRLEGILELRSDSRLKELRKLASKLANKVTLLTDNDEFPEKAQLEIKKAILEVQREIAARSTGIKILNRVASFLSPPFGAGQFRRRCGRRSVD
jgi:hypothetical protein